jgi:hypothetical protein
VKVVGFWKATAVERAMRHALADGYSQQTSAVFPGLVLASRFGLDPKPCGDKHASKTTPDGDFKGRMNV